MFMLVTKGGIYYGRGKVRKGVWGVGRMLTMPNTHTHIGNVNSFYDLITKSVVSGDPRKWGKGGG